MPPADPPAARRSARPHRSARAESSALGLVLGVLRRRGWRPRIEPYLGYGAAGWVRVLGRVLLAPAPAPGEERAAAAAARPDADALRAVRGWRSFLTAEVPGASVTVVVEGVEHLVTADRGGYVDAVVPADLPPGRHEVLLLVGEARVAAPILVLPEGPCTALLSDIDDTVMVTALPRPLIAAWNSLVLHESARRAVPGMAELYRRWLAAHPGSPTFYLSTGPWNVAPALRRFLRGHGYPEGPLLLTDWGPTNSGWFRSGQEHKRATLRRLIAELPQVRWVLVGDDGQHDPQIYGDIAAEHPGRIELVAIRQLSVTEQLLAHGTPAPAQHAADAERRSGTAAPRVVQGGDGFELALRLLDAGEL